MISRASPISVSMRNALLAYLLVMLAGRPARAAEAPPAPPADQSVTAALTRARIGPAVIETIYNEAILRDGAVDPVIARLAAYAEDETRPKPARANALFVNSHLQWRFGRIFPALSAIDGALALDASGELTLHKARVLEAAGNLPEARRWYAKAVALLADPAQRDEIQLRLTFLSTDGQNVDALVKLAQSRDREFRNRAAVALAILNRPAEAVALYEVFGEGAQLQRRHLRLAQWALQAGQAPKAQEEAWQAVLGSSLSRDVRYSLSVLVEAHELDGSWDRLLARLAAQPEPGPDAQGVRVDVLRKLGRYDEAIALIEGDRRNGMSPEGQRRLLRIYSEAGRTDAMIAEFRRLIAGEPAEIAWPRSLSEHFIETGRRDDAAQVWIGFTARNSDADVLLEGGRAMIRLGLDELALAAADKCLAAHPDSAIPVLWYRFELHVKRGDTAKAEAVLGRLDLDLPADSPDRMEIANAYERIKNPRRALAVLEALDARPAGLGAEEKIRLAWLYDTVGQRDRALAVWRRLWQEVPDTRRRLVEDRLLLLAAETGSVGDLAVELEQKLAKGEAGVKDSSLLIRIYTDAGDPAAAIEVIQEYYGRREKTPAGEIASLREQARVYRTLDKHAAFIEVTEKLLGLDPENRIDYLQSLILNHLNRAGKDDREQVKRRLAELRRSSVAADDEFESGVLVMAGLKDQAIDSYRRALARNPGHTDNYLLLADLLKQNRRIDEGVAILQYFAEIAPGDDGFMVAVDGILNLKPGADSGAVRWAQRRVLERITRNDDKFYLYELSAELAQEAKDTKTYLASLENSLVEAGPRRSSVLRELASATEEKPAGFGVQAAPPDFRRNLSFSRRLIALGEEMPPDVYLNVGRTFLRMQNPAEALRAFNLAIDRTDRASLVEESADRFDAAGYGPEAAVLYEKALAGDGDNVSVMMKLANVRSRNGLADQASRLYLRALLRVVHQQPLEVEAVKPVVGGDPSGRPNPGEENFTYLYRNLHRRLEAGMMFTLAPDAVDKVEADFEQALQETLTRAGGLRPTKELALYPRLNAIARIMRRSALLAGRYDLADRTDHKLLKQFGGDAKLVTELVNQRLSWGLRASAESLRTAEGVSPRLQSSLAAKVRAVVKLEPMTSLALTAQTALAEKNYDLAVNSAFAAGNPVLAASAFRQWVNNRKPAARPGTAGRAAATAMPVMLAPALGVGGEAGTHLLQIAMQARRKLDADNYRVLAGQIVTLAVENAEVARDLLGGSSGRNLFAPSAEKSELFALERAAGRKIFTEESLSAAIAAMEPRQLTGLDMDYALNSLPPAARVELFLRTMQATPPTTPVNHAINSLAVLLARPLDAAAAAGVAAAVKDRIRNYTKANSAFGARALGNTLPALAPTVMKNLDRENAGITAELDRFLIGAYPDVIATEVFKTAALQSAGSLPVAAVVDAASQDFEKLGPGYPGAFISFRMSGSLAPYVEQLYPGRKAELLALLEKKAAEPAGPTPALFWITLAVYANDPAGTSRDPVAWLEKIRRLHPGHKLALEVLAPLYRQLGEIDRERETLEQLIAVAGEPGAYRVRLAEIWRNFDHPVNVLEALGDRARSPAAAGGDAAGPDIYGRARAPQIGKLVASLDDADAAGDAAGGKRALRGLLQALPPSGSPPMYFYQAMQAGTPVMEYSAFFDLPAATAPAVSEDVAAGFTPPLLRWLESDRAEAGEPGRPLRLLDRVATRAFATSEFEAAVRTLDPTVNEGDEQYLFYPLLADSYAHGGRMPAEFARLKTEIETGRAGKKEFFLWMELAIRQKPEVMRDLPVIAEKALLGMGPTSDYQRIQLARLYARVGRSAEAVGIYSVAAVSAMAAQNNRFGFNRSERPSLFSAIGLAADAEAHLDAEGLTRFFAQLVQITKPYGGPAHDPIYQRYLLWLSERALDADVTTERLQAAITPPNPKEARQEDLIRYARFQSRVAAPDKALPALRAALRKPAERKSPANFSAEVQTVMRYQQSLGFQGSLGLIAPANRSADSGALMLFKKMFPVRVEAWPTARAWVALSARAIPAWVDAGEVDTDLALQVLSLIALRQRQLGMAEVATTTGELSRLLGRADRVTPATATLALAVAGKVGAPLAMEVVRKLAVAQLLDVRQLAAQVRRSAATEGAPAALALGESVLVYTQNDALLAELETLARTSGREEQLGRLKKIREQASTARAVLEGERKPASSARVSALDARP